MKQNRNKTPPATETAGYFSVVLLLPTQFSAEKEKKSIKIIFFGVDFILKLQFDMKMYTTGRQKLINHHKGFHTEAFISIFKIQFFICRCFRILCSMLPINEVDCFMNISNTCLFKVTEIK